MSRLKIQKVQDGQIPSERIVDVRTADGTDEQVIVADTQVQNGRLMVCEILTADDEVLVELPRETMSGSWRLWVDRNLLVSVS